MKKYIKLAFIDTPNGVDMSKHYFYKRLCALEDFEFELSSTPDYIISLGYGFEYLNPKYDKCIKIYITAENDVPNFTIFDYALGHVKLSFGDRYLRHPIYAHWRGYSDFDSRHGSLTERQMLEREFCSFVVSSNSNSDPIRERFFNRLSKYKHVASGGRLWNNIGGPCVDKLEFISRYKFNIAFENSSVPGYTTEKVMEAFAANTVPIYWGNPCVEDDFNREAMVVVNGSEDIEKAIEEIVFLDKNDEFYLEKCRAQSIPFDNRGVFDEEYDSFMRNIFSQEHDEAIRLCKYGKQMPLRAATMEFCKSYKHDFVRIGMKFAGRVKSFFRTRNC